VKQGEARDAPLFVRLGVILLCRGARLLGLFSCLIGCLGRWLLAWVVGCLLVRA
jgi:hypothetical protein